MVEEFSLEGMGDGRWVVVPGPRSPRNHLLNISISVNPLLR